MKYAIITVTKNGADLACKLQNTLKTCDIYVKKDRYDISLVDHIYEYDKMSELIKNIFAEYEAIIFFTSTGIAVRMIAPFIVHKVKDPAVIVLDEKANFAISLLSGHLGGANELTLKIADILNAIPVITTATDTNKIIAPDVVARKYNLVPYPLEHIKIINSALIQQQKVIYYVDKDLKQSEQIIIDLARDFKIEAKLIDVEELDRQNDFCVFITDKRQVRENILFLTRKQLIIGVGCRKDVELNLVEQAINEAKKWQIVKI